MEHAVTTNTVHGDPQVVQQICLGLKLHECGQVRRFLFRVDLGGIEIALLQSLVGFFHQINSLPKAAGNKSGHNIPTKHIGRLAVSQRSLIEILRAVQGGDGHVACGDHRGLNVYDQLVSSLLQIAARVKGMLDQHIVGITDHHAVQKDLRYGVDALKAKLHVGIGLVTPKSGVIPQMAIFVLTVFQRIFAKIRIGRKTRLVQLQLHTPRHVCFKLQVRGAFQFRHGGGLKAVFHNVCVGGEQQPPILFDLDSFFHFLFPFRAFRPPGQPPRRPDHQYSLPVRQVPHGTRPRKDQGTPFSSQPPLRGATAPLHGQTHYRSRSPRD